MVDMPMANRLNLGGFYKSQGEQSEGELRARYWLEYSNALANKIQEIQMNNPDDYTNPRQVLADIIAGEHDHNLARDNEVNPDEYGGDSESDDEDNDED